MSLVECSILERKLCYHTTEEYSDRGKLKKLCTTVTIDGYTPFLYLEAEVEGSSIKSYTTSQLVGGDWCTTSFVLLYPSALESEEKKRDVNEDKNIPSAATFEFISFYQLYRMEDSINKIIYYRHMLLDQYPKYSSIVVEYKSVTPFRIELVNSTGECRLLLADGELVDEEIKEEYNHLHLYKFGSFP